MSLPKTWTTVPIAEIANVNPPKPKKDALPASSPVTFVPMPAVDANAGAIANPQEKQFSACRSGYTAFADGDVIFAKITPCMENGKAAVARELRNGLGFGSTEFIVLRPTDAVRAEYLHFFVRQPTFRKQAEAKMTGSVGQKRVPPAFFSEAKIALAPLPDSNASSRSCKHSRPALTHAAPDWTRSPPSSSASVNPCSPPPARGG